MRVRRYFAFIDLCGFPRLPGVTGDEEAVAVLTGFRTLVRFIASEHGVRVAKWLGDGAMFVSTDGPALAAALLVLDKRASDAVDLPIRAGFSGGDVILFEGDDYIGRSRYLPSPPCHRPPPPPTPAPAAQAPLL